MAKVLIDVVYTLEVDTDKTSSYPEYVQEIEESTELAMAMATFDVEEGELMLTFVEDNAPAEIKLHDTLHA